MITISTDQKRILLSNSVKKIWTFSVYDGNVFIGDIPTEKMVQGYFSIQERLCSSRVLDVGACEASTLMARIANIDMDLKGKRLEVALSASAGSVSVNNLPMGVFYVDEYTSINGTWFYNLVAYDGITLFDIDITDWYNNLAFPISLLSLRNALCTHIGIRQEAVSLPLDDLAINKATVDKLTGRDLLKAICQINGRFGHVTRTGTLVYAKPETMSVQTFEKGGEDHYRADATHEKWVVLPYESVTVHREGTSEEVQYPQVSDRSLNISGNILTADMSEDRLLRIAKTIFVNAAGISYVVHNTPTLGRPWLEVGDKITIVSDDDAFETYIFERKFTGFQGFTDEYAANGLEQPDESYNTNEQIKDIRQSVRKMAKGVNDIEQNTTEALNTAVEADAKAQSAFNRAEEAYLEAETVEMNVKDIVKGLAVPADPYYCGDKSPTYGRSNEDAASLMVDGAIYIPTQTHTEKYTGSVETNIINCGTPSERSENSAQTIYDAGTPESNRAEAKMLYAGTPSQRIQTGDDDLLFEYGKAYIWQDGGWQYLADVKISDTATAGTQDGDLWYCTIAHTADGVEYHKDTVYRWSAKDGAGLWVAMASKTDSYMYKSLNKLLESVVSITAGIKEDEANIELLTAWKTEVTQSIAVVTQKADANEANITTLLTFMGDTDSGAIKAIAELETNVDAHGAKIDDLVAWMGDTESGAIKAIADVTQKTDANAATIEGLVSWVGDSDSGATKALADIKAQADANTSSIENLTTWQSKASQSIASTATKADANEASIQSITTWQTTTDEVLADIKMQAAADGATLDQLVSWQTEAKKSITNITQKANDNASSIKSLTEWQSTTDVAITSLEQRVTSDEASISSLTEWRGVTDEAITEIRQVSSNNENSITLLVQSADYGYAVSTGKYFVGTKSPSNGQSDAQGILDTGLIYVPTETHTEHCIVIDTMLIDCGNPATHGGGNTYDAGTPGTARTGANLIDAGTPLSRSSNSNDDISFELGHYYTWSGTSWIQGGSVSLYSNYAEGATGELWLCRNDMTTQHATYTAGTLYIWSGRWMAVADPANNYAYNATSMLRVDMDGIVTRVQDDEEHVISLINQSAESVTIQANKINISGVIKAINNNTTTTIDGDKITTGSITADRIDATDLHVRSANIDGAIKAQSITIYNENASAELLYAGGATVRIGAWKVGDKEIYSGKAGISASDGYQKNSLVTPGSKSPVRFFSGAANRTGGSFVVLDDGSMYAAAAKIEGILTAGAGSIIGSFVVGTDGNLSLSTTKNLSNFFMIQKTYNSVTSETQLSTGVIQLRRTSDSNTNYITIDCAGNSFPSMSFGYHGADGITFSQYNAKYMQVKGASSNLIIFDCGFGAYNGGYHLGVTGQIKVQTNTNKTRYLRFDKGILTGISSTLYSNYPDYSEGTT